MKRIYKKVLGLLMGLGVLGADKVLGFFLYWSGFPVVYERYGAVGIITLFALQVVTSFAFIYVYDGIGGDSLHVSESAGTIEKLWLVFRKRFITDQPILSHRATAIWKFIILSWQFTPAIALLLHRKDGAKKPFWDEVAMIIDAALIATTWWTVYSLVIVKLCREIL